MPLGSGWPGWASMIRIRLGRAVSASSSCRPLPINTVPSLWRFSGWSRSTDKLGRPGETHAVPGIIESTRSRGYSAMHPGGIVVGWLSYLVGCVVLHRRCIVLLPKLEPADRLKRPDVENEDRLISLGRLAPLATVAWHAPLPQSPEPRPAKTPIAGATCVACRLRATICRPSVPCSELSLGSNLYRLGPPTHCPTERSRGCSDGGRD